MFIRYNPNPHSVYVGDCVIRAISKSLGMSWEETYIRLAIQGLMLSDMPSANNVWGNFLRNNGYKRYIIPNTCPDCYTVRDFCYDHPQGNYILSTGTHVVTAIDGNYYDSWDSGDTTPIFYWQRKE